MKFAYRIVSSKLPEKYPVGQVFLLDEDCGAVWEPNRYNDETLCFEEKYMRAKFIGRVHARTTRGKVLAINHLLRMSGYKKGFLPLPKACTA